MGETIKPVVETSGWVDVITVVLPIVLLVIIGVIIVVIIYIVKIVKRYLANTKIAEKKLKMEEIDIQSKKVTKVRPGHADLVGCLKYDFDDARNVLERSSARETASRVAVGAICKQILTHHKGEIFVESTEGVGSIFSISIAVE